MATSRIADSVGRVLGDRYRLTRPLGVGASAHVYVAEDVNLRRRVAIKLLHPALAADESFLRRFRAEAQVVASLRHPNILTVFDWGEDGGAPYLVMELLEGGSLRSLLDRGSRLTPAQAAQVGTDAARALDYAHRRGLVHRDIKPANLIFDDEGRVRVADFGLARALAEATWTEPAGAVVGTARYAAPEQARGEKLDGRSDVYSLAVVLVEATTGQVPFAADTTLGTLMARLERPLAVSEEAGPLRPVLESAGQVDPADRLDAAALVVGLEEVVRRAGPAAPLPLAPPVERRVVERDDVDPTEFPGRTRLFDVAEVDAQPVRPGPASFERPPEVIERPHRRRRLLAWLLAFVLLIGAGGVGVAYATGQFASYHAVPDLSKDSRPQASAALKPLHLRLVVASSRYQDGTIAGRVLSQNPLPGHRLREGQAVHVILSLGPQPVAVPASLVGEPSNVAEGQLKVLGLRAATTGASSLTVPVNDVISYSPHGSLVPGQTVTLVVSTGKPEVVVPPIAGASFAAEASALQAKGLKAQEDDVYSDTVPKGQVVQIAPAPGAKARVDSVISVQISKGPHLVTIPNLFGDSVGTATHVLEADGFVVQGVTGNPINTVTGTVPRAGNSVHYGSAVEIVTG